MASQKTSTSLQTSVPCRSACAPSAPEHPDVATVLANLGSLQVELAEPHFLLARALWDAEVDRPPALALARAAAPAARGP